MDRRPRPGRLAGSPRRDHRAGRAQDGHQRAQLRRQHLHGGLRGLEHAVVGQHGAWPDQPSASSRSHHRLQEHRRQELCTQRQDRDPDRTPARLAHARAPRAGRRRSGLGLAIRFRPFLLPQRRAVGRERQRAVFLFAEDREPSRSAPLGPRLQRSRGARGLSPRHDQGDGADRDAARRFRDGRDPVRAARSLCGIELRALGLHLQLHQKAAPRRLRLRRPRASHDDEPVPARLLPAAGEDLPPSQRARDGRDGRADSDQERFTSERRGNGKSPRGQGEGGGRRLRRHVGP